MLCVLPSIAADCLTESTSHICFLDPNGPLDDDAQIAPLVLDANKLLFEWNAPLDSRIPSALELGGGGDANGVPTSFETVHEAASLELMATMGSSEGVLLQMEFTTGPQVVELQMLFATGNSCGALQIGIEWGQVRRKRRMM